MRNPKDALRANAFAVTVILAAHDATTAERVIRASLERSRRPRAADLRKWSRVPVARGRRAPSMSSLPAQRLQPLDVLRRTFGYPAFRGAQDDVVEHVVGGGDALVLMPTGGGKSLCYQIPALLRAGTAIVVSPLIALMQDQVAALHAARRARGVPQLDAGRRDRARDSSARCSPASSTCSTSRPSGC